MRILKGFGKYLVFLLLNGLGGVIAATIMTNIIVNNFAWIFGQPETGSAYGNVVEVFSWGLWGLVGALVAVEGYSIIFKQFPARWMGITTVSIDLFNWILATLGIIAVGLYLGEEIELDRWKDFAHFTASIVTFWYLFRLPPLPRHDRPVAMSAGRYQSSNKERIQEVAAAKEREEEAAEERRARRRKQEKEQARLMERAPQSWLNDKFDVARLHLLAEQGDPRAQHLLGLIYRYGDEDEGVPQNDIEAVKWLRLAADQGYAQAHASLAAIDLIGPATMEDRDDHDTPYSYDESVEEAELESDIAAMRDPLEVHRRANRTIDATTFVFLFAHFAPSIYWGASQSPILAPLLWSFAVAVYLGVTRWRNLDTGADGLEYVFASTSKRRMAVLGAAFGGLLLSGGLNMLGYWVGAITISADHALRIIAAIGFAYLLAGLHHVLSDFQRPLFSQPRYIRSVSTWYSGLLAWAWVPFMNWRWGARPGVALQDAAFSCLTFVIATCALLMI